MSMRSLSIYSAHWMSVPGPRSASPTYGINPVYKVQLGDYLYAVWGYDAQ